MKTGTKMLIGFLIIGTITGITATVLYFRKQAKLLKDYDYKIKGVKVNTLRANFVSFILYLEFINKSDIDVEVLSQKYKIYANGERISSINVNKPITIKGNKSTIIPLNIEFDPKKIFDAAIINIVNIMSRKDRIKIRTVGFLDVKAGPVRIKNFPVDFTYNLQELHNMNKT